MKKYRIIITCSIISAIFILITGWISFSDASSVLFEFSFIFHLIPFGIGFTGGESYLFFIYYILLWLGLSLLVSPFVIAYYLSKKKIKFLTFSFVPLALIIAVVVYIDYSRNKEQEERIALNNKMDKENFNHLKTGDLLFQAIIKNDSLTSDTTYNIGIAFIEGENYALLETKEQVQYVSISKWLENGNNNEYVAKRLINASSLLTSSGIKNFNNEASNNVMKAYDTTKNWSDDEMYNAELIWKMYKRALNIELGKLDTLKTDSIKTFIISPISIFNSKELIALKKP